MRGNLPIERCPNESRPNRCFGQNRGLFGLYMVAAQRIYRERLNLV